VGFSGLDIICVEAGTVIKDEATGKELTVTDTEMVRKGRAIYVTDRIYETLKANVNFPPMPTVSPVPDG
jgi:hypothetical protein